tara:strand:- start:131 stop:337 length:207 start_codon:yes stop_codon:yes gene_type:complete
MPAPTLVKIMATAADAAGRAAIKEALSAHPTITAAAAALGTTARALRRAAQRLGVAIVDRPPGRPRRS